MSKLNFDGPKIVTEIPGPKAQELLSGIRQ
jgi:hypothetical protein